MGCDDDDVDDSSIFYLFKGWLNRLIPNNKISTNTRQIHIAHYIHLYIHVYIKRKEDEIKAIPFDSIK